MDTQVFTVLTQQMLDLREDFRVLHDKVDALLKLCYETNADVKALSEIKNTLRRDVDRLTVGTDNLMTEKQERVGMVKITKAVFTFRNFFIFLVGFVFAIAQHTGEMEGKIAEEQSKEYANLDYE